MAHKLLLADDSVTIQRVIELTFADEDVEVTTVGDGQLAIDRLETDPPDIILADVDMPKRDGYEVAAYVKSRPELAHIPVVLLTGAFEPIDQARAAAAGSSDVLAKPFEPQMVINRVKELLGKKRLDDGVTYASSQATLSQGTQPQMGDPQPAGEGNQSVSLDDYFDQLDAAFSNLQPGAPPSDGSDEVDWPVSIPLDTPAAAVDAPPVVADTPARHAAFASAPAFAADAAPALAPAAAVDKTIATPNITIAPNAPVAPVAPIAPISPVAQHPPAFAAPVAPVAPIAPIAPISHVAQHPPVFAAPVAPQPVHTAAPVSPVAAAPSAPTFAVDAASAGTPIAPSVPVAPVASVPAKPTANPFANLSAAKAEAAARPAAPVISDEVIEEVVSRVLQRLSDRIVRETVTDIVSQTAERLVQEEIERIRTGS
jgi:CheY-like chemotaxis protein